MCVEEDQDQGFSKISDGCQRCRVGFDEKGKSIYAEIKPTEHNGRLWWMCTKCKGSYGAVE